MFGTTNVMQPQPTVMNHEFSRVPKAEIPRSSFNRSHGHKTTFNSGFLVPMFVDEVLPGDSFNLNLTGFGRLATPLRPLMDNMFLETFYFFVPNRLVWDNWEKFNGERTNPDDSTDYLVPQLDIPTGGFAEGSIFDYLGLPTKVELQADDRPSALPLRAYNLIYNEWFRDQNLIDSVPLNTGDGPDDPADYELLKRGKRHDYFTSSLPWPQKGDAVTLPLTGDAFVATESTSSGRSQSVLDSNGVVRGLDAGSTFVTTGGEQTGFDQLYADLTDVTASTINDLREAFQTQKMLERDARSGTRYTEIIQAHFGVTSPDARLQRPEYLGGGSTRLNVSPVPQTSQSSTDSPQGNLAGVGTVGVDNHGFTQSFTEHGHIIGVMMVRADLTYQQGMNRMWSRQDKYDFYWPALAHLGEQEVRNKEIYAQGTAEDNDVFGYQERYAEYRYKPSLITGLFRSNADQSLDSWHLSQDFEDLPVLGKTFIEENPPVDRVVAVPSEPDLIMDMFFDLKCARPMPVYSVPGMIDHF